MIGRPSAALPILLGMALHAFCWMACGLEAWAAQGTRHEGEGVVVGKAEGSVVQWVRQSRDLVAAGELEAALSLARAAVAQDPAYAEAWKQQGRVLMLRGEPAEALLSLEIALELKADDPEAQGWILRLLLDLGRLDPLVQRFEAFDDRQVARWNPALVSDLLARLLKQAQYDLAEKIAARWEKLVPGALGTSAAMRRWISAHWVRQSRERVAAGELEAALSLARAAVAKDPAYVEAWKQQGRVLMLRGELAEALPSLETALEREADDPEVQGWILRLLLDLDRLDPLVQRFEAFDARQVARWNPTLVSDLLTRLLEERHSPQAARVAARWERLASHPSTRSASAAIRQWIDGHLEAAESTLKAADPPVPSARPLLALAWLRLGSSYLERRQPLQAIPALQKALELRPDGVAALRELGWAYRAVGQPAQAAEAWAHGFRTDSRLTAWLVWIAEARLEANQLEEAAAAVERLLGAEPAHDRGRALRLMLLLLRGKAEEAQQYEAQLGSVPGGADGIALGHALADRRTGRFAEAARRLEGLFRSRPDDPEIRAWLADAYAGWAAQVSLQEALYPLQRLVALVPGRAGAWRDLGWSLWAGGQPEEAIRAWDRALGGELPQRETFMAQVVARLAEEGQGTRALELFRRWNPGAALLPLGLQWFQSNRLLAARPLLAEAWRSGEEPLTAGLYLAAVEARTGGCSAIPEHLAPWMERGPAAAPSAEIELALDTVQACSHDRVSLALIEQMDRSLGATPAYTPRIANLLEKAAAERQAAQEGESAFGLYRRLSERDPNRVNVWLRAAQVAEGMGRHPEAIALLTEILGRTTSAAVREGIQGRLADERGEIALAVASYRKSLAADPHQPDLRFALFRGLISLKQFEEARRESDWLAERVAGGDLTLKSHLAETLSALGQASEALKIWEELRLTYPGVPYYDLAAARALFQLCRAEEALPLLEQRVTQRPYASGFELLAEIEAALGHPEEVLRWTAAGLAFQPTARLLQHRAEAAEALGQAPIAQEAAEALLDLEPGNVRMALTAGQAMLARGRQEEARRHYEALLKRNPSFFPSLVRLREIATRKRRLDQALHLAKQRVEQRPWEIDAQLYQALSLAEGGQFKAALKSLRSLAAQPIHQAIPALVYRNVTQCPYPGHTTAKQVIDHLEHLSQEGYRFMTPAELPEARAPDQPRVLVIVANADAPSLLEIDQALQRLGGRATYAGDPDAWTKNLPNSPSPAALSELQRSGRWVVAAERPLRDLPLAMQNGNRSGNPFTHRLILSTGREEDAAMAARLNQWLTQAAEPLRSAPLRGLVYLGGDYGHLSLDTDPQALEVLRDATRQNFAFAFGADEVGFIPPEFDPLRLPGRTVPAHWDANQLLTHLRTSNPLVRARLELAKVLYWQRQHERASQAFRSAEAAGASPPEVYLHWGLNAYQEGDQPTARQKLHQALRLDPASSRVHAALERVESRARPVVELHLGSWEDSDDRSHSGAGGNLQGYILDDRFQLEISPGRHRWDRKGFGPEEGTRWEGRLRWHWREEHWLNARVWHLQLDRIKDQLGGWINLHLPNAPWGGYVEIEAAREEIDTAEAVRARIWANRYALQTYSRIDDVWDLFADLAWTHRRDHNDTVMGSGRLVRRLREWPFWGIGYLVRFADSDRRPPEYWAPEGLQQHQLYLTGRGEYGRVHYALSSQAGYADDDRRDWRFVWGFRVELDLRITSKLWIDGKFYRLETPTYDRNQWSLGMKYHF